MRRALKWTVRIVVALAVVLALGIRRDRPAAEVEARHATPPSRFVRAVAFTRSADQPESAVEAVNTAFHILDSFDIVKGVVRASRGTSGPADFTQWTSAADTKNGRYYFKTYANPQIRVVDLKNLDLSAGLVLHFPVDDKEPTFEDVTNRLAQ